MIPPVPELSPERQNIFQAIQEKSIACAEKSGLPHVTREISLYITMGECPSVLNRLNSCGVKSKALYQELHFKYETLAFKDNYRSTRSEGDEWKNAIGDTSDIKPDMHYLSALGMELSGKSKSTNNLVWKAFRAGVESTDPHDRSPADDYPYQEMCSALMEKYLYSQDEDIFRTIPIKREDFTKNAEEVVASAEPVKPQENLLQKYGKKFIAILGY